MFSKQKASMRRGDGHADVCRMFGNFQFKMMHEKLQYAATQSRISLTRACDQRYKSGHKLSGERLLKKRDLGAISEQYRVYMKNYEQD